MSHKLDQISKMTSRSTGILFIGTDINSPADLVANPLLTDNGDGTFNLNHGGQAEIIDRTNYAYPLAKYPTWAITNNIAVGADGVYVLLIDATGAIIQHQYADQVSELKATDPLFNTDNHIQLGTFTVDGGFISSIQPVIQYSGNIANRLRFFERNIGIVNSSSERIRVLPVSGGLNIKIDVGNSSSIDFGFVGQGSKAPDVDRVDPESNPAFLVVALRDNTIISAGFDLDVLLYESAVGVTTVMTNNRASARFLVSFTDLVGVILGQSEYNDIAICNAFDEDPDIPPIAAAGLLTTKISINKSETDLVNALVRDLPRINIV